MKTGELDVGSHRSAVIGDLDKSSGMSQCQISVDLDKNTRKEPGTMSTGHYLRHFSVTGSKEMEWKLRGDNELKRTDFL